MWDVMGVYERLAQYIDIIPPDPAPSVVASRGRGGPATVDMPPAAIELYLGRMWIAECYIPGETFHTRYHPDTIQIPRVSTDATEIVRVRESD